ncbi:heme-binding protein [Glaciihabitans sp. UYNi722]|uniref:heme-binding protein n=1 Tax=Glaciihabitans sp. UYNi722 TaxID=3156344 RepID=UPI003395A7E9
MTRPEPLYTIEQLQSEPVANVASFLRDDAVRLGEIAVGVIREWERNLAVDVHIGDELAYRAQLGSTGQRNADVIQGKILVATKFGHSSLLARLKKDADPSLADGLDDSYKFWGGCIPIFVNGELVATIGTSGEPDVVDHEAAAEAVKRYLAEVAA